MSRNDRHDYENMTPQQFERAMRRAAIKPAETGRSIKDEGFGIEADAANIRQPAFMALMEQIDQIDVILSETTATCAAVADRVFGAEPENSDVCDTCPKSSGSLGAVQDRLHDIRARAYAMLEQARRFTVL